MKRTRITIILIIALITGTNIGAQGVLDQIKEAAEKQAKEKGAQEENTENTKKSAKDAENEAEWKKTWEKYLEDFSECSSHFDTKALNCYALMALYYHAIAGLVRSTEMEQNCRMKYDLYGMQSIAVAFSTTLLYCPEYFWENYRVVNENDPAVWKRREEFDKRMYQLAASNDPCLQEIIKILALEWYPNGYPKNNMEAFEDYPIDHALWLAEKLFSPKAITSALLNIQRKMEALPCSDY